MKPDPAMSPDVVYRQLAEWPRYWVGRDGSVWSRRVRGPWRRLRPFPSGAGGTPTVELHRDDGTHRRLRVPDVVRMAFPSELPGGPLELGPQARGAENAAAVLTDAAAASMRWLRKRDPKRWTYPALAERFGVSRGTVFHVLSGRTWRHVGPPAIAEAPATGPMPGPSAGRCSDGERDDSPPVE